MNDWQSAWRPIESAPKDGTWILVTGGLPLKDWDREDFEPPCVCAQWTHHLNGSEVPQGRWQFAWYWGGHFGEYEEPTHWMPCPPTKMPHLQVATGLPAQVG